MRLQALLAVAAMLSSVPAACGTEPAAPMFNKTTYGSVEVTSTRIAYREAGPNGVPTILLLHGFPSSSRMFATLVLLLADRTMSASPARYGSRARRSGPTRAPMRRRSART